MVTKPFNSGQESCSKLVWALLSFRVALTLKPNSTYKQQAEKCKASHQIKLLLHTVCSDVYGHMLRDQANFVDPRDQTQVLRLGTFTK